MYFFQERTTKVGQAQVIREVLEKNYPNTKKVILVCDNLNTHALGALHETFEPEVARSLARRLAIIPTPRKLVEHCGEPVR